MTEFHVLFVTSITIAFVHTCIGIDHYLPFIVLSRANSWSTGKTMLTVLLCGVGHVLSSVILGLVGIALSTGVSLLVHIEDIRGTVATYFLIAFGLVYTAYGIRQAVKNKAHTHLSPDGHVTIHTHEKGGETHGHNERGTQKSTNVLWGLFVLFVLGPCEPLIPILMYPAASQSAFTLLSVTAGFAVCTIVTMLAMTFLGLKGIQFLKINKVERYAHALAGSAIFLCGISLLLLPI